MVACLVRDEVAANHARLRNVVASASGRLELDSRSLKEFLCAADQGDSVPTASPETSGMNFSMPLIPGNV